MATGHPPPAQGNHIDRIDRLPSGGIEIRDYKTGAAQRQIDVDRSLQLSIYALACRDAVGLGTPERVTLYFTESALRLSTTRTDEQLALSRAGALARGWRMRAGGGCVPGSSRRRRRAMRVGGVIGGRCARRGFDDARVLD